MLGLLEPALAYLGDTFGLATTSAVSGGEIDGLESALVVLLAAVLLRETMTRPVVLSVLAGLAGLIVLAAAAAAPRPAICSSRAASSAPACIPSWRSASTTAPMHCP